MSLTLSNILGDKSTQKGTKFRKNKHRDGKEENGDKVCDNNKNNLKNKRKTIFISPDIRGIKDTYNNGQNLKKIIQLFRMLKDQKKMNMLKKKGYFFNHKRTENMKKKHEGTLKRNSICEPMNVTRRLYPNDHFAIRNQLNKCFQNHCRIRMKIQKLDVDTSFYPQTETKTRNSISPIIKESDELIPSDSIINSEYKLNSTRNSKFKSRKGESFKLSNKLPKISQSVNIPSSNKDSTPSFNLQNSCGSENESQLQQACDESISKLVQFYSNITSFKEQFMNSRRRNRKHLDS